MAYPTPRISETELRHLGQQFSKSIRRNSALCLRPPPSTGFQFLSLESLLPSTGHRRRSLVTQLASSASARDPAGGRAGGSSCCTRRVPCGFFTFSRARRAPRDTRACARRDTAAPGFRRKRPGGLLVLEDSRMRTWACFLEECFLHAVSC